MVMIPVERSRVPLVKTRNNWGSDKFRTKWKTLTLRLVKKTVIEIEIGIRFACLIILLSLVFLRYCQIRSKLAKV